MNAIKKIDWTPEFSVDVEHIDKHQKKMFEFFNQLIELKQNKKDTKACINLISEIHDYSKLYFSEEEKYLKKKKYPDFGAHSKAHRQFIKTSITFRREISESIDNLTYEMIDELRGWLINHIREMDSLYIPFVRIQQYIEDLSRKN